MVVVKLFFIHSTISQDLSCSSNPTISSEKQSDVIKNLWQSCFVVLELVVGSGGQDKIDKMFKEWMEDISGNCLHKKAF